MFQSSFRFIEKLSLKDKSPCLLPAPHLPPLLSASDTRVVYVLQLRSLQLIYHPHPKLCVTFEVHSWRCSFCGFGQMYKDMYPSICFPGGSVVKNPPANTGDVSLIPGSGDPLEKEMATHSTILAWDRGTWWAIVHGVAESDTIY